MNETVLRYASKNVRDKSNSWDDIIEVKQRKALLLCNFKINVSLGRMPDEFEVEYHDCVFKSESFLICDINEDEGETCYNEGRDNDCWCSMIKELEQYGTGSTKFRIVNKEDSITTIYNMIIDGLADFSMNDEIELAISFEYVNIFRHPKKNLTTPTVPTTTTTTTYTNNNTSYNNYGSNYYKSSENIVKLIFENETIDDENKPKKEEITIEYKNNEYGMIGSKFEYDFQKLPNQFTVKNQYTSLNTPENMICKTVETKIGRYVQCVKDNPCWCLLLQQIRSTGKGSIRIPLSYNNSVSYYYYNWLVITATRNDTKIPSIHCKFVVVNDTNMPARNDSTSREEKFIPDFKKLYPDPIEKTSTTTTSTSTTSTSKSTSITTTTMTSTSTNRLQEWPYYSI